jgi:hypothetical protein
MADVKIDYHQLRGLMRRCDKAGVEFERAMPRVLKRFGVLVQGTARKFCPESPTIAMYARQNKSGKTKRRRSSITTGSLRDSITTKSDKVTTSIFVPRNSRGGKYAERIHDGKGTSWRKRGPRTVQKGADADDKFIYRAYEVRKKDLDDLMDQAINKILGGL